MTWKKQYSDLETLDRKTTNIAAASLFAGGIGPDLGLVLLTLLGLHLVHLLQEGGEVLLPHLLLGLGLQALQLLLLVVPLLEQLVLLLLRQVPELHAQQVVVVRSAGRALNGKVVLLEINRKFSRHPKKWKGGKRQKHFIGGSRCGE